MSQSFSVGEVVIFIPDGRGDSDLHKYTGEVEIVEAYDAFFHTYRVRPADGHKFYAEPGVLRKRPQPPDWNKLATPADIEVPEHV
jgi:hypothetical protein